MGMVVVVAFAVIAAGVLMAAITLTWTTNEFRANAGSRSYWPSAQWYSDCYVVTLDVTGFTQAPPERRNTVCVR